MIRAPSQLVLGVVLITSGALDCGIIFAKKSHLRAFSAREIAQRSFRSVVVLVTKDSSGRQVSLGSGFFVRPDVVATNYHVVKHASRIYGKIVGQRTIYDVAGLVGASESDDLALLKLKGASAPFLPLADRSRIAVGDPVYVVGNPEGLEGTFSQGMVSALRGENYIQITAPISAGSSGGPVLNNRGEVIGVAVGTFTEGQNLNFAVPVANVSKLVAQMGTSVSPLPNATDVAGTPRKGEATPTLRETLDWLKVNLSRYGNFKTLTVGGSADLHVTFQPGAFQGCTVSWTQSTFYEYPRGDIKVIELYSEVPLSALDSSRLITQPGADDLGYLVRIVLPTREKKKSIHVQMVGKSTQHPNPIANEGNFSSTQIYFENRDITDRVTTALRHAIELCVKQKEPF